MAKQVKKLHVEGTNVRSNYCPKEVTVMRSHHRIIEAYQAGGSEERLNLFLECPTLRTAFIEIETREASLKAAEADKSLFWQLRS